MKKPYKGKDAKYQSSDGYDLQVAQTRTTEDETTSAEMLCNFGMRAQRFNESYDAIRERAKLKRILRE
jgi:hypothetical protein